MNTYKPATTKRRISFPTTSVWDGTTWKKTKEKSESNMKKPFIHGAFNLFSRENTASLEEIEKKLKGSNFLLRAFTGLWDHIERNTPQFHRIKHQINFHIFGFVIKSLLFFWPKRLYYYFWILPYHMCLLIILILMVTHCCFGCGSLQLQSVKSSGGTRQRVCARLSSLLRLLVQKQRRHGATGLRRGSVQHGRDTPLLHWSTLETKG